MTKIVAAFLGAIIVAVTFAACRQAEPEYNRAECIALGSAARALIETGEDYSALISLREDAGCDQFINDLKNPVTRTGNLWVLGKHRIVCGDSTGGR